MDKQSYDELAKQLKEYNKKDIKEIIKEIGELDYNTSLKEFQAIDTDKDGYIDVNEFANYFLIGQEVNPRYVEDMIKLFKVADQNFDDKISVKEFLVLHLKYAK